MTLPSTATTHSLTVPGARLHYEVRGAGPLLFVIGSPMASADFATLADALASDHTVVTYDPRGYANSTVEDPNEGSTPESRADDIVAILDDLGAESADVFGSSGGAVTGLALVARHPGRVRTLIAHEPPVLELLPDAARHRADTESIIETFRSEGLHAAWYQFMVTAGFDMSMPSDGAPIEAPPEPTEQEMREATQFFNHELRGTTQYLPDIAALKAARVVIGVGVQSGRLVTDQTSRVLAELLGTTPAEFPSDHGGFMDAPEDFADVLRGVLA